ncbi:MAG TPA: acyltransferase [Aquella sp.]|nr:acyltransferase [Aquella sp.]
MRRFLRIFPVYYLTLAIIFIFNIAEFNSNLVYFLTYTTNFNVYVRKTWGIFGHAWSLAVEEQFYLIWPFLIMFLGRNHVLKALIIFILLGPISSFIQTFFFKNTYQAYILTPECFDSFGIGGLIAYYYTEGDLKEIKKWVKILLPFSIFLFYYWRLSADGGHFQYLRRTFESVIAAAAILFCLSNRWAKWRDIFLENKLVREIGIISYGIYLFHYPLPYFYLLLKSHLGLTQGNISTLPDYCVLTFTLLTMAFLSYYSFERPILSLKSRFKY